MDKEKEVSAAPIVQPSCATLSDEELLAELQRRITRSNQTVEELTSLNEELREVNKKLEESEALKSHFISNITNEIINPFTSILGLSRAILTVDKEAWKKVISMVALIHSEAFSLDFQFRNIFFAAKVEAGEERPEVLDVAINSLITGVVENFRFEMRKKHIEVNVIDELPSEGRDADGNFYFKSDPAYIKLILANLLNNAITFSFEHGEVDIRLYIADGALEISVRDYGVGIDEERKSMIFDRFTRGDNTINSVNRGHGLGLSVSKAVIDLLEGSIRVKSSLGDGAEFIVRLPEAEAPAGGFSLDANEIFFDEEETF